MLVRAGYEAAARVLDAIEFDLLDVHQTAFEREDSLSSSGALGSTKLLPRDKRINDIDQALTHTADSLGQLTELARIIRRDTNRTTGIERHQLSDLVTDGEAGLRRVQSIFNRQRQVMGTRTPTLSEHN